MLRAQVQKALPCSDLGAPSPGPVSGSLTRRQPGRKGAGEAVQGPSPDHPAPRVRSAASRQEARAPPGTLGRTLDLGAVWGGRGVGPKHAGSARIRGGGNWGDGESAPADRGGWGGGAGPGFGGGCPGGRWVPPPPPGGGGGGGGPAPGVSESGAGQLLQKSTTGAPKGLKKGPGISFFGQGVQRKEPLFLL